MKMKKHDGFGKFGNSDRIRNRRRNEKRIGGKTLTLDAFANAKSKSSGYNPSLIKKQREFYRNAKYIGKFKKSVKQSSKSNVGCSSFPNSEAPNEDEVGPKSLRVGEKKKGSLQFLSEQVENKRAEAEKARIEREAMLQSKKEEREKAEAKRKFFRNNMSKRTRTGQPVMKYRIQHILEGLEENP